VPDIVGRDCVHHGVILGLGHGRERSSAPFLSLFDQRRMWAVRRAGPERTLGVLKGSEDAAGVQLHRAVHAGFHSECVPASVLASESLRNRL